MALFRQLILAAALLAATGWLWATYVPGAAPVLERLGVAEILGVSDADASDGGGRGGWGGGGPASVVALPVSEGTIDDRVEAIGDGRALRSVSLRPETSGRIVELPQSGGTYVEEGSVILRLDDSAERIAVSQARLVLEEAQADADRIEQLGNTGAVTAVRQREAQLALETATLALEEAEYELERRTLRAPISGWLGVIDVAQGDRIGPSDMVATISDRSRILIDFRVPERIVGMVAPGTAITVEPLSQSGLSLDGQIHAVDTTVDSTSRTLRVQGVVENTDDRLRAGMAFAVTLEFPGEPLPSVDALALQWSSDGSFVWAVRDGQAAQVPVVIRQRDADRVIVEAELEPGELVVTEGVQSLRPGAEVRVTGQGDNAQAGLRDRANL